MGQDEEADPNQLDLPFPSPSRDRGPVVKRGPLIAPTSKHCLVYCGPERCDCQKRRSPFSSF